MLLPKRKIQIINQMFTVPYRPCLLSYQEEKNDLRKLDNHLTNHFNNRNSINNAFSNYTLKQNNSKTIKSSFPSYNFYPNYNTYNNNYIEEDYSNSIYFHLRNEIIIKNP